MEDLTYDTVLNAHCDCHDMSERVGLRIHRAVAEVLDANPQQLKTFLEWVHEKHPSWSARETPAQEELMDLWNRPWPEIREIFLDPSEEGKRLRSSSLMSAILPLRLREKIRQEELLRRLQRSGKLKRRPPMQERDNSGENQQNKKQGRRQMLWPATEDQK